VSLFVHEDFTPVSSVVGASGEDESRKPSLWDGLLLVLRTRALLVIFGIRVLMRTAFRIVGPVMALFVQELAGPDARVASITGTITGLASATSAASAILFGRLSDRIGTRRILLVCGAAVGILYGCQGLVSTITQFLVLRVLAGAFMGGVVAATSALLAELAPKDRFGAVYGINTSLTAGANAIAPMVGAALTASWGLSSAFFGAAAMYGLATAVIAFLIPASRQDPEEARLAKAEHL
jgi:MFS family permease